MLKLISLSLITSAILLAEPTVKEGSIDDKVANIKKKIISKDEKILTYEKRRVLGNPNLSLNSIEISKKVDFKEVNGWSAYVFDLDLTLKQENQTLKTQDVLFTNGDFITPDFIDIKTGRSLKDAISVDAPASYYDDEHFLVGDKNAKNKLLVFSDPLCPFCIDFVPDLIDFVKKYPKDFGLYYYHFPIAAIHPAAVTLIKATMVAEKNGEKDIVERLYSHSTEFNSRETNETKNLEAFNEKLKTNITSKDIQEKGIEEKFGEDIIKARKVMVKGTPTLFVNGKLDRTKKAYLDLIEKDSK